MQTFSGKLGNTQATEPIEIGTDDVGCILLRFKNGAKGSLFVSQTCAGRKNSLRWEISGSKSALEWDSERPNAMWAGHRDRPNEIILKDPGLFGDFARGFTDYPGGHSEGFQDTFKMCFRAFYDHVAAGDFGATAPFASFEDGHREALLCEAILKSHDEGCWVPLW